MSDQDDGEPKPKDYDIDDGIDRSQEFENFEKEQQEQKIRKKQKTEDDKVQRRIDAQKESAAQYKNRDTVLIWGPTLITAPLVPAFLALLSITIGTTVIQWHYVSTGSCLMLQAYVVGHVAVCYMFLAVYMALLIGPQCCARACGTTTLLFAYWILFGVIFLGLNVFGLFVVVESRYCFEDYAAQFVRTDDTVALYICAVAFVATFWTAFLVLAMYPFYLCWWRNKWKKKTNKVLDGLKFGKKTIDYSGYTSMRDEPLESSESEDEEVVKAREEKAKKTKAAFDEFEQKHGTIEEEAVDKPAEQKQAQHTEPATDVAGPVSPALQQNQPKEPKPRPSDSASAQEQAGQAAAEYPEPDYNQGYYDSAGNWVYYTAEEIAAYEAQQQ